MKKILIIGILITLFMLSPFSTFAANDGLVSWWKFDESSGKNPIDAATQVEDTLIGYSKYVSGVSGNALRYDGYTTHVKRIAGLAPLLSESFSIEAWIAPQTYPWNWTAIVNQEKDHKEGFFFGVDFQGFVGLKLAIDGEWHECVSNEAIPILEWSHIVGTFSSEQSMTVYINGREVGSVPIESPMTPAEGINLLIGESNTRTYPALTEREMSKMSSRMVFDGLIDELKIYDHALSDNQILEKYSDVELSEKQPLSWRHMPSGPKLDTPQFGAFYTQLKYADEWDALWRNESPDVVVTFDFAPIRLVSWKGISYSPCWVTENDNWYNNEFMERGVPMGCAESMSDKQARYSHAKIIENSDARVVLYWRYSPSDILYGFPFPDPLTRRGDWADEYYVIYPDGVSIRKIVMWSSNLDAWHEWSQSLPLMHPGQRPEDLLDENGIVSMANMEGQSHTYKWPEDNHEQYSNKNFIKPEVPHANIHIVNYKSQYKPFLILTTDNPRLWLAGYRTGRFFFPERIAGEEPKGMSMPLGSKFWWWNHWPVAQHPNDGRIAEFPDRPSHSFTSTHDSDPYERTENSMTKIQLYGLTDKDAAGLVPLAKSWNHAPELKLTSSSVQSHGYDQSQRAYVVECINKGQPTRLDLEIAASSESPMVNSAFVFKNWGDAGVKLKVNNKTVKRGKSFRYGHNERLEGKDLIVWIELESIQPVKLSFTPSK